MFFIKKTVFSITSNIVFSTKYENFTNTTTTHFAKCFQSGSESLIGYFPSQSGIINKHFFVI